MTLPRPEALAAVAAEAGRIALGHFRRATAERKADRSLVTAADREVEAYLADAIRRLVPGAGILGEEGTAEPAQGPYQVFLDPIDGTAGFVAGLPIWCICIGILRGAEPVAGVVHLPCTGETYTAAGGAAWWNGAPLPRLGAAPAGDRFLLTHSTAHRRARLTYPGKVRSLGSTAYHVALVARGVAEAAVVGRTRVWDLAGPAALLRAVGGVYEYRDGTAVDLHALADGRRAPDDVLAGTPAALAALRSHLTALA
jgi:myo-inositol-1(or 4)-monophosphatase